MGYQYIFFDSDNDIHDFVRSSDYGKSFNSRLCFAVVLTKYNVNNEYEYILRFNTSNGDHPETTNPKITVLEEEQVSQVSKFGRNGLIQVQNWLDNFILRRATGDTNAKIKPKFASVTVPEHTLDTIARDLRGATQYLLTLPMLLPFLRMVNLLLKEKEKRIREGMKMMGLQNNAWYLSWFIHYFIIFTLISLVVSLELINFFFKNTSWIFVFLWHWLFSMATMSLGFFVSVFFTRAKVGNVVAFVIYFALGFLDTLSNKDEASKEAKFWCSIGPGASLSLAFAHMANLEASGLGLTADNYGYKLFNYQIYYHYLWMGLDVVIFYLLTLYLDQILPSEFGIRKHPLFCIQRKKADPRVHDSFEINDSIVPEGMDPENFEETDPALKVQDDTGESIIIRKLRKLFPTGKLAVESVSFNMYKGQIFALLGHNGAGKTTTINMITGLFAPTSGSAKIFGKDITEDIDQIRKNMGVCPQHNVLFDDLTVKEHLEMFAAFKGVDPKTIKQEVENIIRDLDLYEKRNDLSKNLSGGQKRKLSIAIAFIGNSKFILLDEPTAGMDTSARRKLWDMLKNYKQGKVILLTTHYMDEADYLGDRIGIMGDGKLQCLGRPLFLKTKFGVGYSLTFAKKDINDRSEPIIEMVKRWIPEATLMSNVSAEVAFQLPMETAPKFRDMFEDIDKHLEDLRVTSYGVSVTTLEEVFLNVARITTHKKKGNQKMDKSGAKDPLDDFDLAKDRIKGRWNIFWTHSIALIMKRIHYFKRDQKGLFCELFLPVIMIIIGILITKAQTITNPIPIRITDDYYGVNNVLVNQNTPSAVSVSPLTDKLDTNYFIVQKEPVTTVADLDTLMKNERDTVDPFRKFSVFIDEMDISTNSFDYTVLVDTRAQESPVFGINQINSAILSYATSSTKKINVIISPFPNPKNLETLENTVDGITISFIFSMGMSFIPASVVTFIVKERELNIKHQQLVSGVSLLAYWLSNFFVDFFKYLIPGCLSALMALAFDASSIIDGDKYGVLWAIFLGYGASMTTFVYLTSFLFKEYGTAQMATFFFNFVAGFIGGVTLTVLRIIESTRETARSLQWAFRLLPTFGMANGFLNLSK